MVVFNLVLKRDRRKYLSELLPTVTKVHGLYNFDLFIYLGVQPWGIHLNKIMSVDTKLGKDKHLMTD